MDEATQIAIENYRKLNDDQRRGFNVRINGEEHHATSRDGIANIHFPVDGQMGYISEMAMKIIINDGYIPGGGGNNGNACDNWSWGINTYPTLKDWLVRYPVGSKVDVDCHYACQCPTAGTMILMENGRYKAIEDIAVGEQVYGYKFVTRNTPMKSRIIEVKTNIGFFRVTPNHRFIDIKGREVYATDLKVGNYLSYDDVCEDEPLYNLTSDELKFLGFWLGDGHKRFKNQKMKEVGVTVGTDKKEDFITNLSVVGRWELHSNKKAKVFFLSARSHPMLFHLIGKLEGKELPQWFTKEQYENIFNGYFRADGYANNGRKIITSVDKKLLVGIQYGLLALHKTAKISKPRYRKSTNLCDHPKPIYCLTVTDDYFDAVEVLSVKETKPDTVYVFNITGDHLYFGDNVQHHNCWDYSSAFWRAQVNRNLQTQLSGNGVAWQCWTVSRDVNAGTEFELIYEWKNIKAGDWVVWGTNGTGHIAMAMEDCPAAGTMATILFRQQDGITPQRGVFDSKLPFEGLANDNHFLGAFRYKAWH